jgi:hypothetical protein
VTVFTGQEGNVTYQIVTVKDKNGTTLSTTYREKGKDGKVTTTSTGQEMPQKEKDKSTPNETAAAPITTAPKRQVVKAPSWRTARRSAAKAMAMVPAAMATTMRPTLAQWLGERRWRARTTAMAADGTTVTAAHRWAPRKSARLAAVPMRQQRPPQLIERLRKNDGGPE